MAHTIDIPKAFYDDHVSRELEAPRVVKELARTYRCEGTTDQWEELRSDADYYADSGDPMLAAHYPGLVASARATRNRIDDALSGEARQ